MYTTTLLVYILTSLHDLVEYFSKGL